MALGMWGNPSLGALPVPGQVGSRGGDGYGPGLLRLYVPPPPVLVAAPVGLRSDPATKASWYTAAAAACTLPRNFKSTVTRL